MEGGHCKHRRVLKARESWPVYYVCRDCHLIVGKPAKKAKTS